MILHTRNSSDKLECLLCPHFCKIASGQNGICGVRKNTGESIELTTYGVLSGYALDPVEKKPLYHFYPGTNILSLGSYGCNMRCDFCQNYNISQHSSSGFLKKTDPEKIMRDAHSALNNIGIAFTYNEPIIWFEFVRDIAQLAKADNLRIVMVSNGYVNSEPLEELISFTDAFNIDLKAFNNIFYKKLAKAKLEPVKNSLKQIAESGRHLEITTLIIPGQNDNEKEMEEEAAWIAGELGKDVPLHLSRYFPTYKREDPSTPSATINRLAAVASRYLNFVYTGNMSSDDGQNTYCPECGKCVTIRSGYNIKILNLDQKGRCTDCNTLIYKHFTLFSSSIQN